MKDYRDHRYSNRGKALEDLVEWANGRYAYNKVAVIKKQHTKFIPLRDNHGRVCNVKVDQKAIADFLGRYKGHPIVIEAKNSNTNTIRFDEVQLHQADFIDDFTADENTIGLVLIAFEDLKHFYAIPWEFWKQAYDLRVRQGDRTTPLTVEAFGQTWTVPKKFSVRMDELNPLWEVPDHDYTYGFPYLIDADKYVVRNK